MNELPKLDLKDRKILIELDKNARQSISEIAKKVGLNKNTVNYKIKRLEEEKIVTGYWTFVNPYKLGYFMMRVYFKFFNSTELQERKIIDFLQKSKICGVISKIETNYDLGFMVFVKDIQEWERFWDEFKEKFRKNFWQEKVHIFSGVEYYKRNYLQTDKADFDFSLETIGGKNENNFDELDFKILELLTKNARMPVIEIAEKTGTPERTIAFRIKQLEHKKIIEGYRANFNLEKIGYEYYKLNFSMNEIYDYKTLKSFCLNNPNIIYFDKTLADFDFEVDVEVNGRKELQELINEIKKKFSIRDFQILNFKEYLKLESLPSS